MAGRYCLVGAYRSGMQLELWTDGACSGNPGAGGWAAILIARRPDGTIAKQLELSGGDRATTNNHMELPAVIEGLRALRAPSHVIVHIDSTYVMDAKRLRRSGERSACLLDQSCGQGLGRSTTPTTQRSVRAGRRPEAILKLVNLPIRPALTT